MSRSSSFFVCVLLSAAGCLEPAFEYEPIYGSAPNWNTDQFIEAAYKSLTRKK